MEKAFFILTLVSCVLAYPAPADTVTVATSGGDYTRIQDAIDACSDGWIVEVDDGFWGGAGNRDLDFGGKRITVRSASGPENCTINCLGSPTSPHRAFYFHNGEDANSIVEGFTIKNGYANSDLESRGGAIYCAVTPGEQMSSPTIRNCIIIDNQAVGVDSYGGGIYCSSSAPTIVDCNIVSNSANFGGGIGFEYYSWLAPAERSTITNCTISDNVAICTSPRDCSDNGYGGGIYSYDSSVTIQDCKIISNTAFRGGGICFDYSDGPQIPYPQLVIDRSTISSNSASFDDPEPLGYCWSTGGGIAMGPLVGGIISQSRITGNWAVEYGGGIDCDGTSSLEIVNCIISGNLADSGNPIMPAAGGAMCLFGSSPRIVNSTISSNEAQDYEAPGFGGGGVYCLVDNFGVDSQPEIKNCAFVGNGHHAVYEDAEDSDPNLTYCLFHNNPDGDYYDRDENTTFTGAENINAIADGHAIKNRDGDPMFIMDDPTDPNAIRGYWTADPVLLGGNRTRLFDNFGDFVAGQLVGRHINASSFGEVPIQKRQAYITANTATTIDVVGNLTGYVGRFHEYKVVDYHIQKGSSCIDTGTIFGAPTTDIEGNPRPIDVEDPTDITQANPNGDSIVDTLDIVLVATNWLRYDCQAPGSCDNCDIAPDGGDGVINYLDYGIIYSHWLQQSLTDIGAYELQPEE